MWTKLSGHLVAMAPEGEVAPAGGGAEPIPAPAAPAAAGGHEDDGSGPVDEESPSINWDEELADGTIAPASPASEPAATLPSSEPQPARVAQPAPQPPVTAPPAVAAQPAQPAAQPAQPTEPTTVQPTPEELATRSEQARAQVAGELERVYTESLTDADRSALALEPEKVMPRLLAQAAMDGAALAVRHINAMLPQVVQQTTAQTQGAAKAWEHFDSAHPDLAKPEYRQTVFAAAQIVKQNNPKGLKADQIMARVARVARGMLDLPDPGATAAGQENSAPAAAPVAPHTPVARGRAAPSAPAKPRTGADGIDWAEVV